MNLFHRIDDAQAIVRAKGGVYKQAELYHRGDRVYVKHASGFVRVEGATGNGDGSFGTSSPSLTVLELPDDIGLVMGARNYDPPKLR
jgi:hypothetical protein